MGTLIRRKRRRKLSNQEWAREISQLRQRLDSLTLFDDIDLETAAERMLACEADFFRCCKTYLPHYFTSVTQADFHDALVELAMTEEVPGAVACPRGFAKSTILSFAFPIYCILFEKKRFIVLCMETVEKAEMQVWRILLELQHNRRIINDFGELVEKDSARGDFTTLLTGNRKTTTRILAMGAGQSARGLINAQFRPDLFILDDSESREQARNPKRVAKLVEMVLGDYLGCMCAEGWTFFVVGTIICNESMLDQLMRNEYFNRLLFKGLPTDENGVERSAWEEVRPTKKLQLLRQTMGATRFQSEIQNEPVEDEGTFKQSWFRHWESLPAEFDMKHLIFRIDPSYSATGDNKAMALGNRYQHTNQRVDFGKWRYSNGTIVPEGDYTVIVEMVNRKCSMDEMIQIVYQIDRMYRPIEIGIDGTYAQKIIFQREFARYEANEQYGRLTNLKFYDLHESKAERIIALESSVERGLIVLPKPTSPDVRTTVQQFVLFGQTGVNDDGPDVVAALDERLKPRKRKAKVSFGRR